MMNMDEAYDCLCMIDKWAKDNGLSVPYPIMRMVSNDEDEDTLYLGHSIVKDGKGLTILSDEHEGEVVLVISDKADFFAMVNTADNCLGEVKRWVNGGKKVEETCCICGTKIEGYGNNPDPVRNGGVCCDICNDRYVIPARLIKMFHEEE